MRKKNYFSAWTIILFLGITFISCSKSKSDDEPKVNPIELYTNKFLNDETFATYFKYVTNNALKINGLVSGATRTEQVDTTTAYDYVAEIATSQVMLRAENPGFFELPQSQQIEVMNNICSNLALESYRQTKATSPLVINATETYNNIVEFGPAMRTQLLDISWQEFTACTAGALSAAFAEYGGVAGDVWRLFSQGSTYLTWGSIWSIAKRVVRSAVPWYKVVGVAIGYASCLWAAA